MESYMDLVKMQIQVFLKNRIRYKVGCVSDLILLGGTYVFAYYFGNSQFIAEEYSTTIANGNILLLIGFIFWQFAVLSLGFTSASISSDSISGNMETKIQSVYPLQLLYFINLVAGLLSDVLVMFFIVSFTLFMNAGYDVDFARLLTVILFTIPNIIGMYGIGLIIGSIVIS